MLLFRKKMPKACAYCVHGAPLEEDQILCPKRGVMPDTGKCRKFRYDPCKRIPLKVKKPDFDRYSQSDFSL